MCGIVGIISAQPQPLPTWLDRSVTSLAHRGPDDVGTWLAPDGTAALGHRRLAVIDPSPAGHQPMTTSNGRVGLTFNGEIYNHRDLRNELRRRGYSFSSGTDSEVLLTGYQEWGIEVVRRLRGMFAFAIVDLDRRRALLARDRAGEKPLFLRVEAGTLRFASELKALLVEPGAPRRLDRRALNHYLAHGFVPGALCILDGYQKLPAGTALVFDASAGVARTHRYWDRPSDDEDIRHEPEDLLAGLHTHLRAAVAEQLVADVPVGVLLSGGVDSSIIAALAAEASSKQVRTFTVSFPGEGEYDEAPRAATVASFLGTDHTVLEADRGTAQLLPLLARQFDEPLADSSIVPMYLLSKEVRRHVTVALGGDGGDELFGGYTHHVRLLNQERLRRLVPQCFRNAAARIAAGRLPTGMRGRQRLLDLAGSTTEAIARAGMNFDPLLRQRLLAPTTLLDLEQPEQFKRDLMRGSSAIARVTGVDFDTYLTDDILTKVDRSSMLTSLEVRSPWLDHRVIEFAFRDVPGRLRATKHEGKILSRMLAGRLLPDSVHLERKQGLSLPLDRWFAGEWGELIEGVVRAAPRELFDHDVITSLLDEQRRGRANSHRLFALTMFELWRREYGVTL